MQTIYIEEAVAEHRVTLDIIKRFPKARNISINRFSEVFNPKSQNFRLQKQNPALILAAKHDNHVLKAPENYNIGGKHNYYFSHMMNCIYDCRYCFLQGMYASANYVVFVNHEDFFNAIRIQSKKHGGPSWYFSGYDCDSLALEPVTRFTDRCLSFFETMPQANLELRTKSTQIRHLLNREPLSNCVVAFSFTPDPIARKHEHRAPTVEKRIQCLEKLQQAGWTVGLRFDPLIKAANFEELYDRLFSTIFERLEVSTIHSVSLGPFRLPKPFYKKLIQLYPDEALLAEKMEATGNLISYPAEDESRMITWCSSRLLDFIDPKQFFPCV